MSQDRYQIEKRSLLRWFITAGVTVVLLLIALSACMRKPDTFADSIRNTDAETAVTLAVAHIDSIALNDPAKLKTDIREICETLYSRGDETAAIRIACYPYGIDPKERPDIAERLLTSTLLPGKKAPLISQNGNGGSGKGPIIPGDSKYTLVFFYESTCRSCQAMVSYMIENYEAFETAGIRIVSISSDRNEDMFREYASGLPWGDRLCDLKGYDSPNFINYGVANTPVTFLIDQKGIVVDQYGSPKEVADMLLGR